MPLGSTCAKAVHITLMKLTPEEDPVWVETCCEIKVEKNQMCSI